MRRVVAMLLVGAAVLGTGAGGASARVTSVHGAPLGWAAPVLVGQFPADGPWSGCEIAVADFNGDGHQDVLITRDAMDAQHTFPVTVLLGDGKGGFTDATNSIFRGAVPRTQYPRQIVIADFNGDGRSDAFIADTGDDHAPWPGYQNTLILSAPHGKLVDATANLPQVSDYTHSAAAADVNGDGTTDLYIGNIDAANHVPPRILLNDGTGHFRVARNALPAAQTDLNLNLYTGSAFVDVNGDGRRDLVLSADTSTSQSAVLLNDGKGHFTLLPNALPPKPFGPDAIGLDPTPLELNGDGHPDLVISYTQNNPFYVGRWIQVLINDGDGTFRDETASRLPQSDNSDSWVEFFQPRDIEGNGLTDLGLQTNGFGSTAPVVYLLNQNGGLQPGPSVSSLSFQTWAFIDAFGDGSSDIIGVANGSVWLMPELRQAQLSRLRMRPAAFRPARSGASTARARTGTTVSYEDAAVATTTFTVDRAMPGIHRGRRCVPRPRGARPGRRCTRFTAVPGHFTHRDRIGPNRFHFSGRIGGRALPAGEYRLDATVPGTNNTPGPPVATAFEIIR